MLEVQVSSQKAHQNTLELRPENRTSDSAIVVSYEHPLVEIFREACDHSWVGVNPKATVATFNPRWMNEQFGEFCIGKSDHSELLKAWALTSNAPDVSRLALVPPETGRAVLLSPALHPIYRDILVKGSGLVERFARGNKLRYASRGFNGVLELSEAERDMVNSELLYRAGVLVSAGIGVIDHHQVETYDDFTAWTGNYIRGFRVQTRISNLFEMDIATRKRCIDDAMRRIEELAGLTTPLTYSEYFRFMLEICAKNVAILQAIGFTQDSFHYGQVSLCGELTDLGIGTFKKPTQPGVVNTMHPWFRYERQPILMQNILYKTHAVKAEPDPVLLDRDSRVIQEQQSLYGAIRSFSEEAAAEIDSMKPDVIFWELYQQAYQSFDSAAYRAEVLSFHEQYFNWTPEKALHSLPAESRALIAARYDAALRSMNEHYENQEGTWERRGPTSLHRQFMFAQVTKACGFDYEIDFSPEAIGFAGTHSRNYYFNDDGKVVNQEHDLSWKPAIRHS